LYRYLIHAMRNGVTKRVPIAAVNGFADGQIVQAPGRPPCLPGPGHTPGHCPLHMKDRDILLSGDALCTFEILTGQQRPCIPADFVNENSALALESLARVENLEAATVLPGQGEPWKGGVKQAVELA